MTSYTVYLPPEEWSKNQEETFRLIPDTKAPLALIFPPFWLAWHRLWLALLVYVVIIFAILLLAISYPGIAVSYLSILPGLYLLLEGYQLVRNNLENKGWRYAGIVEAENREEAEIRFLLNSGENLIKSRQIIRTDNKPNVISSGSNKNNMSLFPE